MKKILLFLSLLASSSAALAQATFRPGYIVSLAGDTVRGAVDYRGEQRNALLCRFKPTTDAAVTEYEPGQIRGYGFTNGHSLQSRTLPGAAARTQFVQLLVLGKASLYYSRNELDKDVYFVGTAPAAPLETLAQHDTIQAVYSQQQGRTVTTQVRTYPFRSVLWRIMADCPAVQATVAGMELRESVLIKAFTAYNACAPGTEQQYVPKSRTSTARLTVLAGMQDAALTYTYYGENKLKTDWKPTGGVGIMLQPGRLNPHFSLHLQALYLKQEYTQALSIPGTGIYANELVRRTVAVDLTTLRVPMIIRYTFLSKYVQPYLQVGAGPSVFLDRRATRQTSGSLFNMTLNEAIGLRTYSIGALLGAGISVPTGGGSVQLEARADRLDIISEVGSGEGLLSNALGLSFLLGYTFGK